MPILWNVVLDEMEKVGAVSEEEARRALDRLDTLDRNELTGQQVARYALLGGVSAPAISAIADTIEGKKPFGWSTAPGGKQQALRSIAATAVKGAIGTGLIPLVRNALDRNAEKSKLRSFVGSLDMPRPEELAPPKLGFATSEYSGPTSGGGFNLVSDLPTKPAPSLKAPVMKTATAIKASEILKEAMVTRIPGGSTPGARLRSARTIGKELGGRDMVQAGPSISKLFKSQKGRGSGDAIFGASKTAEAIKAAYTFEQFKALPRGKRTDWLTTAGMSVWDYGHGENAVANQFPGAKGPAHLAPDYRDMQRWHMSQVTGSAIPSPDSFGGPAPRIAVDPTKQIAEEIEWAKAYEEFKKMKAEQAAAGVGAGAMPRGNATVPDAYTPTVLATVAAPAPIPAPAPAPPVHKTPLEVMGKTPSAPQAPIGRVLPAKPLQLDMSELSGVPAASTIRPKIHTPAGAIHAPASVPRPRQIAAGLAKAVGHLGGIPMLRETLAKIANLETNPGTVETGRQGESDDYVWTQDVDPEAAGTTNSGRTPGLETGHSETEKSVSHETIGLIRGLFTNYQNAARADKEQVADLFEAGRNGYYVTRNPTLMEQVKRVVGRKLGAKKQVLIISTCPPSTAFCRCRGCRECLRSWGSLRRCRVPQKPGAGACGKHRPRCNHRSSLQRRRLQGGRWPVDTA